MIIMAEDATQEETQRVLEEIRKYGLKAIVVKVPCEGFNNKKFKEER